MKPRKDSADSGAGSGCMARLVRFSSFLKDCWRELWRPGEPTLEELWEMYDVIVGGPERYASPPPEILVQVGNQLQFARIPADNGLPRIRVKFVERGTLHEFLEMEIPYAKSIDEIEKMRL